MALSLSALALVGTSLLSTAVTAYPSNANYGFQKRDQVITATELSDSYDFIICGGGTAGLALASRLSEDSNKTVLVVEAGDTGYAYQTQISTPAMAYYDSLLGTENDWIYTTTAQTNLGDRECYWPRGKVLGGSSAINGMYMIRPSEIEVDAWSALSETNTTHWNWDSMFAAMKKSESFQTPSSDIASTAGITYDADSHGTDGPVAYGYPGYEFSMNADWMTAMANVGVDSCEDAAGGSNFGAFIATSAILSSNWTRSYARAAYIDPLAPRSNLDILVNARVMKVNTETNSDGTVSATGISYSTSEDGSTSTITATTEVILAGGAIGSPQMLLLSGIGPASELTEVGISSVIDLPGVGYNLQDHLSGAVTWSTNYTTAGDLEATLNYSATDESTVEFYSYINSATAYVNATTLWGDWQSTYIEELAANYTWAMSNIMSGADSTVLAGYGATYNITQNTIATSAVGMAEILLSLTGEDQINIQCALQHPFSRGQISVNSTSAWDNAIVNPGYLSHPGDILILREGLKLARTLFSTAPLASYMITETSPGSAVSTDDEWDAWLMTVVGTEYHPSSTCAMMPLDMGGVVDANLLVYGTTNLRVVDASITPFALSAHLAAPVYGIAEQAADIIKMKYWAAATQSATTTNGTVTHNASTNSGNTTTTSSTATATSTATSASSGSTVTVASTGAMGLLVVLGAFAMLL